MGKKQTENQYGIKTGDIFVSRKAWEDGTFVNFYQVTRLRGVTQVVLREIEKEETAFDDYHEAYKPLPGKWSREEEIVKRVELDSGGKPYVRFERYDWAHLGEESATYVGGSLSAYHERVFSHYPGLKGVECDIRENSGVFLLGKVSIGMFQERAVEIRYPDGRQEKTYYKDLFLKGKRVFEADGDVMIYKADYEAYYIKENVVGFIAPAEKEKIRLRVTCCASLERGNVRISIDGSSREICCPLGNTTETVEFECEEGYIVVEGDTPKGSIELKVEKLI